MAIFALQSPAGGFLDEDLAHFNKGFDDWCARFDTFEDARIIADTLPKRNEVEIVEITPLSYPKYFFHQLQGTIYATKAIEDGVLCIVEPVMGAHFRLAVCNLSTKQVHLLPTRYKSALSVESAFAVFL